MRKRPRLLIAMAAAIACLSLPACSKVSQQLKDHPDEIGEFCAVDTLNFGAQPYYEQVKISYDAVGNPVSMLPLIPLENVEFDDLYLRYDRHNRLKDFLYVFPGNALVDIWHRFSYPSPRVVVDSLIYYEGLLADPNPPPPPYIDLDVFRYDLDEHGRIVRSIANFAYNPAQFDTAYIAYDEKGNKVVPGVVYDDKINIYRTNKVWQLLFQDYSMNNPIVPKSLSYPASILSYNAWWLPLVYDNGPADPNPSVFAYFYSYLTISYSCGSSPAKLPRGY